MLEVGVCTNILVTMGWNLILVEFGGSVGTWVRLIVLIFHENRLSDAIPDFFFFFFFFCKGK